MKILLTDNMYTCDYVKKTVAYTPAGKIAFTRYFMPDCTDVNPRLNANTCSPGG